MFSKLYKNSSVKNILIFSLSNLGDVILSCPVVDILLRDFPAAQISVIVAKKSATLFADHPRIQTIVYDKRMGCVDQIKWFMSLRKKSFDLVVDLRQTALCIFLPCRFATAFFPKLFNGHILFKHLERLRTVYPDFVLPQKRLAIVPKPYSAIQSLSKYAVVAPGAADSAKRWSPEGFSAVADALVDQGYSIVFVGAGEDEVLVNRIQSKMAKPSSSLVGKTDLCELAFVLSSAKLVIAHDSGVMHLASYFNAPLVVLWGPTPLGKSEPWSQQSVVVYRQGKILSITVEDVLNAIKQIQ